MDSAAAELDTSSLDDEAHYERFVRAKLKRNYAAHYLHGMLGMTGFRLVNAPTFMPAYLNDLSHSKTIVGLGLSLGALGAVLSPIVGATLIEHRKRVLPFAIGTGMLMRLQVLGLAVSGWLLSGQPLLLAILGFLFLLGLFTGVQRVAFQLLLGKVIPVLSRGRLQAWRNVTGGAIAATLSYFAGRYLVGSNALGNGYGTTFLLAFVLTSLGLTALAVLMHEPEPPTVRPAMQLRQRLREFPVLLQNDRGLRHFLLAQALAVAGRIATPFYVLYASKTIALSGTTLGALSLAYLGADTASNLIWGYTGDRFGFRATWMGALGLWASAIFLLLHVHSSGAVFLAFVGLGAAQSGYMMSVATLILELGPRDDTAMRLALSTTAEGLMTAIGPLAGGIIATALGYALLFNLAMGFELAALALLIWLVEEPRKRRRAIAH